MRTVLLQELKGRESCYRLFQQGTVWCGTTSSLFTNGKGSIRNCVGLSEIPRIPLWTSILTVDRSQTSRIHLFWVVQTLGRNRKMVLQLQPHCLLWNICLGKWTLQMLCHAVQISKKLGREMLLRTEYTRFVANTAVLKATTGEETEATSGVDDELESLRQCLRQCSRPEIGRMQVVQTISQSEMNFVFLEIWSWEEQE